MQRIKTFEIVASVAALKRAFDEGRLARELQTPLGAMLGDLAGKVYESPTSVYLCSADEDATARNYFGYTLAKAMLEHAPRTLLVDCDFLQVGLGGIVPQRDALGFLDLLLYGSSLGVITQETRGGVATVGAGSFPLPKKSPFVMDAFENTSRYLVNQASCVIFCGPALDDEEEPHPIVAQVDLPVLFRAGVRTPGGALDPVEEKVLSAKLDSQVWSVWLVEPVAPTGGEEPDLEETQPAPIESREPEPEVVVEVTRKPRERAAPAKPMPEGVAPSTAAAIKKAGDMTLARKSGSSVFPMVVTSVLAVFLVAFLLYWLYLTRSIREKVAGPTIAQPQQTTAVTTPSDQPVDMGQSTTGAAVDTIPAGDTGPARDENPPAVEPVEPAPREQPKPVEAAVETAPVAGPGDIVVTEKLGEFAGRYVIHISSFRTIESAERDANYLADSGHPVIIAHVDLGVKGFWYRVYVGPLATRDDARMEKIKLDELPRVKFTHITKVAD